MLFGHLKQISYIPHYNLKTLVKDWKQPEHYSQLMRSKTWTADM